MFALATAIKLTPLIVIVPLVAWRDWKSVRAFAVWGIAILGALWAINGGDTLSLYFHHVLPSMSHGIVMLSNKTIGSALQVFWRGSEHGSSPRGVAWAGSSRRSHTLLCSVAEPIEADGRLAGSQQAYGDGTVLASLLLHRPVSLLYAYVMAAPAVVILAKQALDGQLPAPETTLLVLFTLSVTSLFDRKARAGGKLVPITWQ